MDPEIFITGSRIRKALSQLRPRIRPPYTKVFSVGTSTHVIRTENQNLCLILTNLILQTKALFAPFLPESDVTIRIQGKNPRIINNSAEQRLAEKGGRIRG